MTTNSKMVLAYLKDHYGEEVTKDQVCEALKLSKPTVTGSFNGLAKKGFLVEREEVVEVEPATENRAAKTKTVRYSMLNEEGLAFDPDAEAAK